MVVDERMQRRAARGRRCGCETIVLSRVWCKWKRAVAHAVRIERPKLVLPPG